MKQYFNHFLIILIVGIFSGCAYFQKKDEPPPLPPIEETKPPLTMKGDYFKSFPWSDLAKPRKDGNDPDARVYTIKEGETLETLASNYMGDPGMAGGLANYNELISPTDVKTGDKIVVPNPIVGVSSKIMIKSKGDKDFGEPRISALNSRRATSTS